MNLTDPVRQDEIRNNPAFRGLFPGILFLTKMLAAGTGASPQQTEGAAMAKRSGTADQNEDPYAAGPGTGLEDPYAGVGPSIPPAAPPQGSRNGDRVDHPDAPASEYGPPTTGAPQSRLMEPVDLLTHQQQSNSQGQPPPPARQPVPPGGPFGAQPAGPPAWTPQMSTPPAPPPAYGPGYAAVPPQQWQPAQENRPYYPPPAQTPPGRNAGAPGGLEELLRAALAQAQNANDSAESTGRIVEIFGASSGETQRVLDAADQEVNHLLEENQRHTAAVESALAQIAANNSRAASIMKQAKTRTADLAAQAHEAANNLR